MTLMHPMHSVCTMTNAPDAYSSQTARVAANVRAEVARRGVSQTAIASALNMNQAGVSRRMSGRIDFTASELANLAEYLGIPVAVFFEEVAA